MNQELADRLREAVITAQREDDLPDFLAERLFVIAECLSGSSRAQDDIDALIEQVTLYDTYGQTGYLGMGVNSIILDKSISRVEQKLGLADPEQDPRQ